MSVIQAVEALPDSGLTLTVLEALDSVVPGEWSNVRSFDALIREVAPGATPGLVAAIRARAQVLERDPRYARALQVYALVDRVDQVAAGAVAANKVTSLFGSLSFLEKFTPKPETTQAIDAGLKLVGELVAFGALNGIPSTSPEGLSKFVVALSDYARFDLMRIAAWVVLDGVVPLGPDFVDRVTATIKSTTSSEIAGNAVFEQLAGQLPGETAAEKQAFVARAVDATGDWVKRFIEEHGLTQQGALKQLQGALSVAEGGIDYVAAAVDASTAYFSHTGTLTVGRALARHAQDALKDEVWQRYVASL
jgi:hypothetical protein